MRKRFPTANELVYDNYNSFVIRYRTTERPSDCVASLAANSKGIGLSYYHGAKLSDPDQILQGSGSPGRSSVSSGWRREADHSFGFRKCSVHEDNQHALLKVPRNAGSRPSSSEKHP